MDLEGSFNKQLGQSRPANTSAASIYTLASKTMTWVTTIFVSNTTGSATTYCLYYDEDGTTYSAATSLGTDIALAANTTHIWEFIHGIPLVTSGGSLGIKSGTNDAVNFTVFGFEKKIV